MTRISRCLAKTTGAAAMAATLAVTLPLAAQSKPSGDTEASAEAPMTKGERKLAQLLEGRVAGEPVSCIPTNGRTQHVQTVDKVAYVYGRGDTIYVQRTDNPGMINSADSVSVRRINAYRFCRLDRATTFAPVSGITTGFVVFEDFIPYTRVKVARSGTS